MTMSAIECVTADELRGDEAWWRIYETSFPASERESPDVILKSVLGGVGVAIRARRENTTFGLATTHLLSDPPAVFLVYLAVARSDRNRGAGGELFESAWESGAMRLRANGLQPVGLIWEVDPPTEAGNPDARRRFAFFERHGGRLLDRRYLQPPVDGATAVPMRLMFRPATGDAAPTAETVEALVRAMYFDKYGTTNGIDTEVLESLLSGTRK